ncbi:hypothetical protein [Hyphomicrobium nitrativorans]|nr:hypothetical protein [Hyphomicrobium nitrativorans]
MLATGMVWVAFAALCVPVQAQNSTSDDPAWTVKDRSTSRAGCWHTPRPQTLEEIGKVYQNGLARERRKTEVRGYPARAMLALSDGRLRTAYSAGLLVGWGETAQRPDFAVVTAAGVSALIAPFAFLGAEGDQIIADIFACDTLSFEDMASRAVSHLTHERLERIAQRHEGGDRLVVALPGSAARAESVWDLGAIAASRNPEAATYIERILLAAVDPAVFIDPETVPGGVGTVVRRNRVFREVGSGEPFLSPDPAGVPLGSYYLIHNGVLFPDEGDAFAKTQREAGAEVSLVPAHDFFLRSHASKASIRIASPRPYLGIQPQSDFDMAYMRALFVDTFRQARMGREWRRTFPDRERSYQ